MVRTSTVRYLAAFNEFKFKLEELKLLAKAEKSPITTFLAYCLYSALNCGLDDSHKEHVNEIELDDVKNLEALSKETEPVYGIFEINPRFVEILEELKADALSILKENRISSLERQYYILFSLLIILYKSGDLTIGEVSAAFELVGMYADLKKAKQFQLRFPMTAEQN